MQPIVLPNLGSAHETRDGSFKLSNDPRFEEKLIDVVGPYLAPPDNAIVLCLDEKSSVQALDRTQPSLPMVKGRAATMVVQTTVLISVSNRRNGTNSAQAFSHSRMIAG